MSPHRQTWVKVNAPVDEGIAEIVALLSEVPGLRTIDSCQGEPGGRPAHVSFYYGPWLQVSRFMFEALAPRLEAVGEDATVSVEIFNGSAPLARLRFAAEATPAVAAALRSCVQDRP